MQQLYQAVDRIEAQMLSDFLGDHLLDNTILGDYLSGAIGELPADIYPSVWILYDEDLPRARELLQHFLAERTREPGRSWVCRGCGELIDGFFDLCWRCGGEKSIN
ncbi:MAG TPA: hypothetical protein DDY14_10220 [Chromatiaceae bacterium]|jgi:hypothetical protein|nr:MAG: hypothetical protein N838_08525 [Thiohalocapsa sp. PB-PSB1]QQO56305.1 MAG: DUF2007 domain-containing protein [Thiohalocapsa sp. PB-PSB1]HBG95672.1 hypothetical protein [Chromatiaceae bacterium]HCS90175.1 hypothetical protein [Chromatiaceae bacterium]